MRYPEVARLPDGLRGHRAVVDGEIVAMDERGRPDFGALQNRMHRTGPEVRGMAAAKPVTFLVFDLLSWDGEDLLDRPYAERRERLDTLDLSGHRWVTTPWFRGGGERVHAASLENELEGIVAKRLDSPYRPGVRCARVAQGQERPGAVGGGRGLAARPGTAGRWHRLAAVRRPGRRGPAGLRRARRDRVQRPGPEGPAADAHRAARRRRSTGTCRAR